MRAVRPFVCTCSKNSLRFLSKGVVFLQGCAWPHTARLNCDKRHNLGWESLSHPAYSADISTSDYHLSLSLDDHKCNRKLLNPEALETELNNFSASKNHEFYRSDIYKLVSRWYKITDSGGDYFSE
jgi:hypothetical protein